MVLQVYLDPCTVNSRKVLAGLAYFGTPYELHFIDYFKGEQKSDSFTKINPHATVPAAVDGDLVITESNAILMYIADQNGGSKAYPQDLKKRADCNRWLLWEASVWFQTNYVYLVEYIVKPLLKAEPDDSVTEKESEKWNKAAGILDARLAQTGKWLLGDDLTIADIAIGAPIHLHEDQKIPLDKHKHLSRWLHDLEQQDFWKKTQDAVDKALIPEKYKARQQHQGANGATNGASKSVTGELRYTKDVGEQLTELYFFDDPKAAHIHEPGDDPQVMKIHNAWDQVDDLTIDQNGFALKSFHSAFPSDHWDKDEEVRKDFYPEVVEFLKKETGATRVEVFDHTIRTRKNAEKKLTDEKNTSQRAPVSLVHCDYTAESAPLRVRQLFPDEADKLLARRVAFINVWKPLKAVEENPLTMCDIKSTAPEDFFKLFLRYRDRTGENYVMRHSDKHHWFYFPDMTVEQSILLKTYDSDTQRAQWVGHTAFTDPTSKPNATYRESCEIRTICFF